MALDQVLAHLVENLNAQMSEDGKDKEENFGPSAKSALTSLLCDRQLQECRLEKDKRDFRTWQKIEFAKLIRQRKHILFGECDGAVVTAKAKEDAWREIQHELEEMGADSFKGKPWMRLRDHDWQYIRRHAMNRYENGKVSTGRLSELDEIVVEIVQGDKTSSINNNVSQDSNDSFGAQLCSLLAASSESTQNGSIFGINEIKEELTMGTPERISESPEISSAPTTQSHSTTQTTNGNASKRHIDSALRNALASLSCAFGNSQMDTVTPTTTGQNNANVSTSTNQSSYSNHSNHSTGSIQREPPAKRGRVGNGDHDPVNSIQPTIETLQRQKLELEMEHMRNEEMRRQERHLLEIERLRISVSLMKKCFDDGNCEKFGNFDDFFARFQS
ncbi:unnamed protein product, partial [Mesorhabditis belari]|uniref:Regulatory protein zeste n=1 Tax=Mesorhabditis belari TaxID=2138241 RepID=A0AAF3FFN4_9BILA